MLCAAYVRQNIFLLGHFNILPLKLIIFFVILFKVQFSFLLFTLTTKSTRNTDATTTLMNHIWTTLPEINIGSQMINTNISDHLPVVSQFKLIIDIHPYRRPIINSPLTLSVLGRIFVFIRLIICQFYTTSETNVGTEMIQTLVISVFKSIDPSQCQ